ncbi:MAG: DUF4286 family protein [Muribaculaceae bacterium]|nr:DUF4286 family protein [Muribaculaceae bacterium]
MILINTTFSVDANIADAFTGFIRDTYIPLASESGLGDALLSELRVEPEMNITTGQNARTFALQMRAPSQKVLDEFRNDVVPRIYAFMGATWGTGAAFFETTLDILYDPAKK